MLSGAFATIGGYWKPLVGIALALFGAATAVLGIGVAIAFSTVAANWDDLTGPGEPDTAQLVPLGVAFGVLMVIGVIAYLLASAVVQAAVPVVLQEAVLGRPIGFGTVWRRAWSRVWAVIGTVFLLGLAVAIPFLVIMFTMVAAVVNAVSLGDSDTAGPLFLFGLLGWLVLAPVAIWLWVKFSLAPTIVVFEAQRPVAALRRSSRLVQGSWWRVLGITLLAFGLASVVGYMIQMPFQALGVIPGSLGSTDMTGEPSGGEILALFGGIVVLSMVSGLVSQLFSSIFPPLMTGLLYVDLRMRNEGLAPVLAEAAAQNLPEQYGPPPTTPA
ncbi:hypothetical protein J7F02_30985 [Streptomyces sp. ISL-112]|uniref:hypothetical protein n=1 Tax=unclassified Streptomyces TaxID=2593676 RepID=UPI001BEACCB1|nr:MULTISPECIES: hypothetical protein [unclassified Streptomyces]MBT2429907.1 hypothetical protein [Streptomyces sp. ISL-112]MBT2462150.1 hypothetical protein [Streptomyces sp. ISL-63]